MKKASVVGYTVVVHEAEEGGFWVEVPVLGSCFTQGDTVEQALENAKQAIECHIAGLKAHNEPIPRESGIVISRVEVALR
jgi:predicted RNase H-like HicB family nuclease